MALRLLGTLLLLAVLTGCGGAERSEDVPGKRTTPILWERSGGVGGVSESIVVRPNDSITYVEGRGAQGRAVEPGPGELDELLAALQPFGDLDEDQQDADDSVSDAFVESVTYDGRTVTTDEASDPDSRLTRILDAFAALRP